MFLNIMNIYFEMYSYNNKSITILFNLLRKLRYQSFTILPHQIFGHKNNKKYKY